MRKRHLMLFNLYHGGHHAEHLHHLVNHWISHDYDGELNLVVSPALLEYAPELVRLVVDHAGHGVRITVDPDARRLEVPSRFGFLRNATLLHRSIRRHVLKQRPDQVLLTYFDHTQLPLALDLRFPFPVQFGGIYFRPTLHYPALTGHQPGMVGRTRDIRKKQLLRLSLQNPHFRALFCLDVFAPPAIEPLAPDVAVVALPEPYQEKEAAPPLASFRGELGISAGRKVLLLFGALSRRKGVIELLNALFLLPADEAGKVSVVLAGRPADVDEALMYELIRRIRAETAVQLITCMDWISPDNVQQYFAAADLVLAPYQLHVGSSGILVRAAHAGAPVLGSDYGMVGALIQRHRLGVTVDSTLPTAIAEGICTFLNTPSESFANLPEIRHYAEANTAETFASTIFRHLNACFVNFGAGPESHRQTDTEIARPA